jgi:hypothetical protein
MKMRMSYKQSLVAQKAAENVKKTREELKQENFDFLFDYVLKHNLDQEAGDGSSDSSFLTSSSDDDLDENPPDET